LEDDSRRAWDQGLTRAEWLLLLVLAAVQLTHSLDFMILMPLGPQCRQELRASGQNSCRQLTPAYAQLEPLWRSQRCN
jgi:hypothetical protein